MPIAPIVTALPHRLLVTLALLLSLDAQALTLGRVQGAALIGRPLAVAVQVQLDPGESITSACFEADVFHADARQNPAAVQVRLEPAATPEAAVLRITSASQVDEPVVTIYVRAGCAQMSSRRYVLLADIVSEQAAAVPRVESVPLVDGARMAAPSVAQAGAAMPGAAPAAVARSAGRGEAGVRSAAARRAAPARSAKKPPVASRPAAQSRGAAASAVAAPATGRSAGQSRLQLDPLEQLSERVATLESNANAPAQTGERETREMERLDRLDASLKSLLALARKNEASLLEVRSRLDKAQADRFSDTLVYALLGLLLLSLLAIAYLLARINRGTETSGLRWFDARPGSSEPDSVPPTPSGRTSPGALADARGSAAAPAAVSVPATPTVERQRADRLPIEPTRPMTQADLVPGAGGSPVQVDVSLVEMSESTFDRLMQSGSTHSAVRRVQQTVAMPVADEGAVQGATAMASRPRLNADDLIDIRQRAEFFVTLGQTDQAVQVLEARIAQDGASCPQVYLDLLQLFHSLGLKADFDQLRDDFSSLFNVRVPEFAGFADEGRPLEDYPGAVDRLIRVWSRPTVLDTLAQMVFAGPDAQAGHDAFDLAAFRDLLLLHAVAQSVRSGVAGSSGAFDRHRAAPGDGNQVDINLSELFSPESAAPTHNLIDFDLGDIDLPTATGKPS